LGAARNKPLWRVSVETTAEAENPVGELLGRVFNRPAAIYSDEETKVASVSVYCEEREEFTLKRRNELKAGLTAIRWSGLNVGAAKISVNRVAREDWAESWKRHFKALEIGGRLLVKPSWIKRRPHRGQAVVVLDPGLSFGTGNHPTTDFCLRALVKFREPKRKQSFLDIGTGSGILAIAAAKLGYTPVRALDFDAAAVRIARANARQNRVRIQFKTADITEMPQRAASRYDFMCANLIGNLLLSEMPRMAAGLKSGGALALSGILRAEFIAIAKCARRAGLRLVERKADGEWESGVFRFDH
jgi:ribosomal protein L11 methyltransferase